MTRPKNCKDCPFTRVYRGHNGLGFRYALRCGHYEAIVTMPTPPSAVLGGAMTLVERPIPPAECVPEWCPLPKGAEGT